MVEVKDLVSSGMSKPRFRKRDKVMFYGRKMLRKVSSVKEKMKMISGQVRGPPGKKRKMVMKLARRLLQLKLDNSPQQLKVIEPPAEYLQEDISESLDQRLPAEVIYMLQNIRMFGNFEKPLFLELIKHIETVNLLAGQYLFNIGTWIYYIGNISSAAFLCLLGDPDTNIYIVQSGKLGVYISETDGTSIPLKTVKTGESICSLLSFTDNLTSEGSIFKTVSSRALQDSSVLQLPVSAFQEVFEKHPDALVRAIQIIMVRLQRVTFLALHQYLGLSSELVKTQPLKHHTGNSSPIKLRMREHQFKSGDQASPVHETDPAARTPTFEGRRRAKEGKDYDVILEKGIEGFRQVLGLENSSLLEGKLCFNIA